MTLRFHPFVFVILFLLLLFLFRARIIRAQAALNFDQIGYVNNLSQIEVHSLASVGEWLQPDYQIVILPGQILSVARVLIGEGQYEEARNLLSSSSDHYRPLFDYYTCLSYFEEELVREAGRCWKKLGISGLHLKNQATGQDYQRWFETALVVEPSSALHFLLGMKHRANGLYDEGYDSFAEAVELDSGWNNDNQRFLAYYLNAYGLYQQRDTLPSAQVQEALNSAIDIAPHNTDNRELATIYELLAQMAIEDQDYESAANHLKSSVSIFPTANSYLSLASAIIKNEGDTTEEALEYFNEAARLSDSREMSDAIRKEISFTQDLNEKICDSEGNQYDNLREVICS